MITISELANEKINELLQSEQNANLFLRVGVKPGGCSGLSYAMGFDDELKQDDTSLEVNGLKIVVDPTSARYLYGVVVDYKQSGMSGGFTIENPNAVASCGCGSSFKMKDEDGLVEKCDDKVEA
jgi:iron-sulfur cluster assembly protein